VELGVGSWELGVGVGNWELEAGRELRIRFDSRTRELDHREISTRYKLSDGCFAMG
jgi:hypothetical protein